MNGLAASLGHWLARLISQPYHVHSSVPPVRMAVFGRTHQFDQYVMPGQWRQVRRFQRGLNGTGHFLMQTHQAWPVAHKPVGKLVLVHGNKG